MSAQYEHKFLNHRVFAIMPKIRKFRSEVKWKASLFFNARKRKREQSKRELSTRGWALAFSSLAAAFNNRIKIGENIGL